MEVKLYNSDSEIHKLNKSIEMYTKKVWSSKCDITGLELSPLISLIELAVLLPVCFTILFQV